MSLTDTKSLAKTYTLIARMNAVMARIAGMQAENATGVQYDKRHFDQAESELESIANELEAIAA